MFGRIHRRIVVLFELLANCFVHRFEFIHVKLKTVFSNTLVIAATFGICSFCKKLVNTVEELPNRKDFQLFVLINECSNYLLFILLLSGSEETTL